MAAGLRLVLRPRAISRVPALIQRCFIPREQPICAQKKRQDTQFQWAWSRHYHTTVYLRQSLAPTSGVECSADGKKCKVTWLDGEQSTYHAVWLRHNCQCPECWDDNADQKLVVDVNELRSDLRIHSVAASDSSSKVDICWSYEHEKKKHHGYIDLQWLKKYSYSAATLQKLQAQSRPSVATSLPLVSYSKISEGEEALWKWLKNLNEYGICLVTDIPTIAGEIKKLAKSAGGVHKTYYGETFHVVSAEKAVNVAYTTQPLPFHMDLQHFESPPGLQFLHCLKCDDCVEGGENILVDLFPVAEEMRRKFPQHFATLTQVPATFERFHTRREIPAALQHQKPHIILDSNEKISAIAWHPQSLGPLRVPEEDVERYYEAYVCFGSMIVDSKLKLHHKLKPGEALTFHNRRFVHSRTGFMLNGGMRHLEGVYVNIDAFKSKVRLLASKFEPEFAVKTVFNQDHGGY